jgi:valyl-tRNA synthetase
LELVKDRVYGSQGESETKSAQIALGYAIENFLKLFAPFMPFVTEEVWSWWKSGSIHQSPWPGLMQLPAANREVLLAVSEILTLVRKIKSDAQVSMKTEIATLTIAGPQTLIVSARLAEVDLQTAARAREVVWVEQDTLDVTGLLVSEN